MRPCREIDIAIAHPFSHARSKLPPVVSLRRTKVIEAFSMRQTAISYRPDRLSPGGVFEFDVFEFPKSRPAKSYALLPVR